MYLNIMIAINSFVVLSIVTSAGVSIQFLTYNQRGLFRLTYNSVVHKLLRLEILGIKLKECFYD